ncbi:MAG: Gfo/Idh/MocA family oxidoreductase [Blastocatellia bacterium]|nr:Gfo/Idh/MocA family oxidoreductase [Blastocatellia bacterium]
MNTDSTERRDFLKGAMAAGLMVLFTEEELLAAGIGRRAPIDGPPVKIGLIGAGAWGKEILSTLSRLPMAEVRFLSDPYEPAMKKGLEIAPRAATAVDYRKLLEASDVEAVIIATPTHKHKEIALAALQAGKHVYCEAPLANTIEDARAIAVAAQATKVKFQGGLQGRSNAIYGHILQFVRSGVLGTRAQIVAQWNRKQSWRRPAPTAERERELNWRLNRQVSVGLAGEIGLHQFDLASWYLKALPISVQGLGSILNWNDGRDVPDTIHTVLEYPNNVRMIHTSTLVSSFSDAFTVFEGSDSSLMLRENRGWMVKEADSPLLGWEVYAKKETIHNETGICMVADATKLLEQGKEPGKDGALEPTQTPLSLAMQNFIRSIRENEPPVCGPIEAWQATVIGIKAHEAVMSGGQVALPKSLFDLK